MPECQGTPCTKQARFKPQRDSNPQPSGCGFESRCSHLHFSEILENLFIAFDLLAGVLNVFPLRVQKKDTEPRTVYVGVRLTLLPTFNRRLVARKQLLYAQTDIFETFRENLV